MPNMIEMVQIYAPILVIVIIGIAGYWWYKKRASGNFGVNTLVLETRANDDLYPVGYAKAGRFKTSEGKYQYKIKFKKFPFGRVEVTKPVDFDKIVAGTGGQWLFVLRKSVDQIVPIKFEYNKEDLLNIKILPEDLRNMAMDEIKTASIRYLSAKKWFENPMFVAIMLLIVFAVAIAIIMYGSAGYLAEAKAMQIIT